MIRGYRASDLAALRRICVLTGDAGRDASGRYSSDGLLPDVYLEPFVRLHPESCWVLELDGEPVGYLLGVLDTVDFVERWRTGWSPEFARRHPLPGPPAEQWLRDYGHEPDWMLGPQVASHPAHLHIDLLPAAQGGGWGRKLLRTLGAAAVAAGVPGIHLGMARDNVGALAFYTRLGFTELPVPGETLVLGIVSEALAAV